MNNLGLYNRATSGRDITVYLCDKLLDGSILSYNIVEGGSTDKLASYNSNVTQHFALSPTVAEITLNYYHSPELDDKINGILYTTMLSTIQSMTSLDLTKAKPYSAITYILKKALDYVQENYKTNNRFNYEDISKRILSELHANYSKHAEEFKEILKMNTMSLSKKSDVVTNSAITRLTMVYSSFITMYYNSTLYVMANVVKEESIVTDLLFKHWFFMCLHSRLNLYIVSNRKRYNSDDKADFEKYIGIFPIGAYINQSDNSSAPVLKAKTFYSIGRFDDDLSTSNRFEAIEDKEDLLNSFDITSNGITFERYCEYKNVNNSITMRSSALINNFVADFYKLSMALSASLTDNNKVNLVKPFSSKTLDLSIYENPWSVADESNNTIIAGNSRILGHSDYAKLLNLYRDSKFTKNKLPTKELINVCFGEDRKKSWETLLHEKDYMISEVLNYRNNINNNTDRFILYKKNKMMFLIRTTAVDQDEIPTEIKMAYTINDGDSVSITNKALNTIPLKPIFDEENNVFDTDLYSINIMDGETTLSSIDIIINEDSTFSCRVSNPNILVNTYKMELTFDGTNLYSEKNNIPFDKNTGINISIRPDANLDEEKIVDDQYSEIKNKLKEYYGSDVIVTSKLIKILTTMNNTNNRESLIVITDVNGSNVFFKKILIRV